MRRILSNSRTQGNELEELDYPLGMIALSYDAVSKTASRTVALNYTTKHSIR
mgnify:CR=1 FL=1